MNRRTSHFFLFLTFSVLLASYFGFQDLFETKVLTEVDSRPVSIDPRHIAANPSLETEVDPFKQSSTFISEVKDPGFKFTTLGIAWEQYAPEGTLIEMEVRFQVDDIWTEWMQIDAEEDFAYNPNPNTEKKYGTASSNPADQAQYKILMTGNGDLSPYIKNQEITYLKTAKYSLPDVPEAMFSAFSSGDGNIKSFSSEDVISRSQWGADESLRYMSDNDIDPQLVDLSDDFYEKYGHELTVAREVEQDENGDRYRWPLKYPQELEKIIIHHTATTTNLDNPNQAIRDIYYYHAVSRGWGDIGYNYIMDKDGEIYEGRFGGEGVIGAHAGPGNHGSIGIAVLGNYETASVSEAVVVSLSEFIYKKSKIHGFSPEGYSDFRGEMRENVFGHKEVMSTTCPGKNLISQLPVLRILAQNAVESKTKFVEDYDYQDLSDIFYIQLKPEESKEITFEFENIGTKDWNSTTTLSLGLAQDSVGLIKLPGYIGKTDIPMTQSLVEPGETASFKFTIKAQREGGTMMFSLMPKINGKKQDLDETKIPLTVEQPIYKYELLQFTEPGEMIKAGKEFSGQIKLKNLGNIAWTNSGTNEIYFQGNNSATTAELEEEEVKPGQNGTFKYELDVPGEAGTFYEEFIPIMDDVLWSPGEEISFSTNIYEKAYDGEIFSKTPLSFTEKEVKHNLTIQLRNLGSQSWSEEYLKILFLKNPDIYISDLTMTPETVSIGETAKLQFKLKPGAQATENQLMYIQPKINGELITKRPIRYEFKVQEPVEEEEVKTTTTSGEDNIRIKLSFDEDPEISANGSFSVYSGSTFLEKLSSNESVKISRKAGKFEIETDKKVYEKSTAVRVVAEDGVILEITNFEHRPTWNLDLNDNQYRGTLEVDYVAGEVITINELPLESYMRGIAEISDNEELEKIKAIMVAARSYAYYYMTVDEKFPGMPYHLDDNPDNSQKYLGYGFEKRAPNVIAAIIDTAGEIVSYKNKVVKTPYFNQSDGSSTKSAEEVWGWTNTPYLLSVDDSYCGENQFFGHGVGLSGCGAKEMAVQGFSYQEILNYYYTNIDITKIK
jgi:hypothetical protein